MPKFLKIQRSLMGSGGNLKCVEPENLHITLKFLGDVDDSQLHQVVDIIETIEFSPFDLYLKRAGVFPNLRRPRVVWVGVEEGVNKLSLIFDELEKKLTRVGFKPERRRFNPHLTVCRVRSGKNRAQLIQVVNELRDIDVGSVQVKYIKLKKSVLTPKGPIYSDLALSQSIEDH
jgi:2'-5' RNA ligase